MGLGGFLPIHGCSWNQSKRSWAPILHFCVPLLASRDPGGIQSGSSWAPMSGGSQIHKTAFFEGFGTFLGDFSCFPTGPNTVPKTRKLVPDWIPTGSRLDPDCPKVVPKNAKLVPDCVPIASRLVFFNKTLRGPISKI